jgi:hypothetical protein
VEDPKTTRAAAKAATSAKSTMRQDKQLKARKVPEAGETAADVLVELPGGTARITIQAKAGVRRTARDWLRIVETLARSSLSPAELREQLPAEPVGQQLTRPRSASSRRLAPARRPLPPAPRYARTHWPGR